MQQLTEQQKTLADAALTQKINVVHHAYVDITGDLIAGSLLGQILYWFGVGANGQTRARIEKDGYLWIAKTRSDWWDEIRITPKQYDRAAKMLKDKGFIVIKTMKFAGNPTTHIRIVPEKINAAIDAWKIEQVAAIEGGSLAPVSSSPNGNNDIPEEENPLLPKGEKPNSQNVNNEVTESGISSYTENTKKDFSRENTHYQSASAAAHAATVSFIEKEFNRVWEQYPKKEGKQKAQRAFEKAIRGMGTRRINGEPYTSDEILAEVVLYRQYIENALERGEMSYRYIPTGGNWFESESWTNEYPSISSKIEDYYEAIEFNKRAANLRIMAAAAGKADEETREEYRGTIDELIASFPY